MTNSVLLMTSGLVLAIQLGVAAAEARPPMLISAGRNTHPVIAGPINFTTTLWNNALDDSGSAINSQNFETSFDAYDSEAADDFIIPAGHTWKVKVVHVIGQYFAPPTPPPVSWEVCFYKNRFDVPTSQNHPYRVIRCQTITNSLPQPGPNFDIEYRLNLSARLDITGSRLWPISTGMLKGLMADPSGVGKCNYTITMK